MTESWNRRAWRIAWPTVLSNVSVPLLGAVDLAVVGHLPDPKYLGAVAVGALIFTVIYHGFIFLRMGTTGLTAQALGLAKPDEVRAWLVRGGVLAGSIGCGLVACQMPIIWVGNALISPSPEIATLAGDYIAIRIWGAPAALFNFALLGWFFGIQKAHAALITQVFMNVLNISLDLWFVTGLELGVEGVAYATVIAQVSTVVVGLVLVQVHLKPIGGQFVTSRILDGKSVRRMLQINGDIFIRSVLVQGCFAVITVLGARFGEMTLAANAILFNFVILIAYILDGYSHAAETLVGEAVGARNTVSFHNAVMATVRGALIGAVILTVLFWSAGSLIIDIITSVEGVRNLTRSYLPWMIAMPLISVWSFLLDGIFIGGTWSRQMRNGMIQAALIYAAALGVFVPIWGNHGLWLAVTIFLAARAFTLALPYRRLVQTVGHQRS